MTTAPHDREFFRPRRLCAWAALALFLALLSVSARHAIAQSGNQPHRSDDMPADEPDAATLKSRLSALRKQAEQERTAAAEARLRHDEELQALAAERAGLADRLLTLEIERERNAGKLKLLADDGRTAAETAQQSTADATSLAAAIRDAAEQLRLHLREVPGTEVQVDRLAAIAAALAKTDTAANRDSLLPLILEFLAFCDAAHDQATSVRVATASIFTASGDREEVKLLSIGHARFAYETTSGGRVGLALSSAQEAAGYRWTENLPADVQAGIREAIAACESSPGALVAIPFDPTGRVRLDEVHAQKSIYEWFAAGGMVVFPLIAVAVAAVALVVERTICLYARNPAAGGLANSVLAACRAGEFDRAVAECANRRGIVPRVLAACLARRPQGQRAMEDAIQEQLLQELPRLQRFMGSLATLAGIAPLLGLLGTVTGIIQTFNVIRSFGNANPALMAGGISEALITTALGLMIAVPVVIAHSILRSRSDRILADAERHSATLLTTLVHRPAHVESMPTEAASPIVRKNGTPAKDGHAKSVKEHASAKEVAVD